jgi:hypothetical protein
MSARRESRAIPNELDPLRAFGHYLVHRASVDERVHVRLAVNQLDRLDAVRVGGGEYVLNPLGEVVVRGVGHQTMLPEDTAIPSGAT